MSSEQLRQFAELQYIEENINDLPEIDQEFPFEKSVVQIQDMEFIPDLEVEVRWVQVSKEQYQWMGFCCEILYELRGGRYVWLKYHCCHPRVEDRDGSKVEVWKGELPPTGRVIPPEAALRKVSEWQFEPSNRLKSLVGTTWPPPPAEPPPARPLSHWAGKEILDYGGEIPTDQAAPMELAREVLDQAIICIHEIREWPRQAVAERRRDKFLLGSRLFSTYRVDPKNWWGDSNSIPPKTVHLWELPFPKGFEAVSQALSDIAQLIEGALAVLDVRMRRPGQPDSPTIPEVYTAKEYLIEHLPALETLSVTLKTSLESPQTASGKRTPTGTKPPSNEKPPSISDWHIFTLACTSGKSQTEVAKLYTAGANMPMSQGQVSRCISKVQNWLKKGYEYPDEFRETIERIQTLDPALLDMGANQDKRTRRQRKKQSGDRA